MKYYRLPRIGDKLYRGDWEKGPLYGTCPGYLRGWYKVRITPVERWTDRIRVPDTYAILRGYIL